MQYLHILLHLVVPTMTVTLLSVKSAVVLIYIFLMFLFSKNMQYTGWLCVTLTQTRPIREEWASAEECLCEL